MPFVEAAAVVPEEAVAYGLFSRRQALSAGYSESDVARLLRSGQWVPWARGLYRDINHCEQPEDRLLRATLLGGPMAAASHLSAAAALGWDLLDESMRATVTVPRTHGSVRAHGNRVLRRALSRHEVTVVGVLPVTTPLRTAVDLAADEPAADALVAIDSGLRLRHLTVAELNAELRSRSSMPRHPHALRVVSMVDPDSGSPTESVARLIFSETGLPAPFTQYEVVVDGRFLGRVDFAWPDYWLIVEIDGFEWHSGRNAFRGDRLRQNELELAGWTVLRFPADDVRNDPDLISATVARALPRQAMRS